MFAYSAVVVVYFRHTAGGEAKFVYYQAERKDLLRAIEPIQTSCKLG